MMHENEISDKTINCCIRIHERLGPGLLESVYEEILHYELNKNNIKCERQVIVPIQYDNIRIGQAFIADLIVEDKVIIELKSIETVLPVHKKQLLTYLKLTGKKLGLLINFNSKLVRDGITRVVNGLE